MSLRVLQIDSASDGTFATPAVSSMVQNDGYFLDKIAERWAKDLLLPQSGIVYRLNALPVGYAGYEKSRPGSSHVDRYLYGHPAGVFRSLNELYPHFKHLQDNGGPLGCACKLCGPGPKRPKGAQEGHPQSSPAFGPRRANGATSASVNANSATQGESHSDPPTPPRRKQIDDEGCQDVYRGILDEVRDAGAAGCHGEVADPLSQDWSVGHEHLMNAIKECSTLPTYLPRLGELVLFPRSVPEVDRLAWDSVSQTVQHIASDSTAWLGLPKWEAGVVTQLPVEPLTTDDLVRFPPGKKQNITNSGYRVEPLSRPGDSHKLFTQQRKYLPLHLIRPLWTWKECLNKVEESDWHPTIKAALTVASSFCIIGKHKYTGSWPEATIFANAVYLGAELITVGDTVRLMPRNDDQGSSKVTDVLKITSIRLLFVNLDEANDDDYDESHPYNTCLHISGRPYTLDPERSYDGVGKTPLNRHTDLFPRGLADYGTWYPMLDPAERSLRLELPYTRILSRCADHAAAVAWFAVPPKPISSSAPAGQPPALVASSFLAVNSQSKTTLTGASGSAGGIILSGPHPDAHAARGTLDQGLAAVRVTRAYSTTHDARVDRAAGKSWYWADSRIEQLDLHEVNGRAVGVKDHERTRKNLHEWRRAVKVLAQTKAMRGPAGVDAARELEVKRGAEPAMALGLPLGRTEAMDVDDEEDEDEDDEDDGARVGIMGNTLGRMEPEALVDVDDDDSDLVMDDG